MLALKLWGVVCCVPHASEGPALEITSRRAKVGGPARRPGRRMQTYVALFEVELVTTKRVRPLSMKAQEANLPVLFRSGSEMTYGLGSDRELPEETTILEQDCNAIGSTEHVIKYDTLLAQQINARRSHCVYVGKLQD